MKKFSMRPLSKALFDVSRLEITVSSLLGRCEWSSRCLSKNCECVLIVYAYETMGAIRPDRGMVLSLCKGCKRMVQLRDFEHAFKFDMNEAIILKIMKS